MMQPNQLTTPWLIWSELQPYLELGDLIEFRRVVGHVKRRIYTHWAVVIASLDSKIYVAHLSLGEDDFVMGAQIPEAGMRDSCIQLTSKIINGSDAKVRRDELSAVARDDLCRINNSLDSRCRPFPPAIVIERANMELGTGGYNILFNNCEHFAKHCRYGSRQSDQATLVKTLLFGSVGLLLSGSLSVGVAAGCLGYAVGKFGPSLMDRYIPHDILT